MERMCDVRRRHQRSGWTAHATHIRGRTVYRLLRPSLGTDLGEILRKGVEAPRKLTYPQTVGRIPKERLPRLPDRRNRDTTPLLVRASTILDASWASVNEILKLDESCSSNPKSEISDWTGRK